VAAHGKISGMTRDDACLCEIGGFEARLWSESRRRGCARQRRRDFSPPSPIFSFLFPPVLFTLADERSVGEMKSESHRDFAVAATWSG